MYHQTPHAESQVVLSLPRLSAIVLLILCGILLTACTNEPAVQQSPINTPVEGASNFQSLTPPAEAEAQARTVAPVIAEGTPASNVGVADAPELSIGDISGNTDAYLAETVNVRGEVTEVLTTTAFRVSEPGILGGEVLVVVPGSEGQMVQVGDTLIIRGVVREFDRYNIETHTGVSYPEAFLSDLQNDIVLMAQSVTRTTAPSQ